MTGLTSRHTQNHGITATHVASVEVEDVLGCVSVEGCVIVMAPTSLVFLPPVVSLRARREPVFEDLVAVLPEGITYLRNGGIAKTTD
jgi:hypothetical protein